MAKARKRRLIQFVILASIVVFVGAIATWFVLKIFNGVTDLNDKGGNELKLGEPELRNEEVVGGLTDPVDITFPNQQVIFYALKNGEIKGKLLASDETWSLISIEGISKGGDRGLLALAIDHEFYTNKYIYACYSANDPIRGQEVRVSRWEVSSDLKSVDKQVDIVTGIPSPTNRNQGCALGMDRLGYLWIGTGDGGSPTAPQDPSSLGGKVLRVERDGNAVEGNIGKPFDRRVFSYGHRNIVGIALLDQPLLNGAYGYFTEAGTQTDELNPLLPGNFGWDPSNKGLYNEDAPMTNFSTYEASVKSIWPPENTTISIGGVERLGRKRWQGWQGRLVIAGKNAGSTRLVELDDNGNYKSDKTIFTDYSGIRTVVESPSGDMYLATSGASGNDKIIRVRVICTVCD